VARIRAVTVTTPAMLSDLIANLAPMHLDIVAELGDRRDLLGNLRQLRPDLVVIGLAAMETDAAVRALHEALPNTKFLALSADGRRVFGYGGTAHLVELADASPQDLIDFLCS
jgi:DNA-binding NarL/FixJ family response regulator